MSFQRAVDLIKKFAPRKKTFIVHIGDGDQVPGDPANSMYKKGTPKNPISSPKTGIPYPIPLNQKQWQDVVDRIRSDFKIPFEITVAYDGLVFEI